MKKNNDGIDFIKIFKNKKIPILTLDQRWYELFPNEDKPSSIKDIEDNLNQLLQYQGKLTSDMKDLKHLKSKLMKEIITNMNVDDSEVGMLKAKKLDQNQKFIKEISEKIKTTEDEIIEIPYKIKAVNEQLIIESAKECYKRLNYNTEKNDEITQWVNKIRGELKEKILIKQDMEEQNNTIYSYMHDLLGHELLQNLDETFKED
jgi:hypothetical protein